MLFKDKKLQLELEKNGYLILSFLNPSELEHLNKFYNSIHKGEEPPNFIDDIHMTTWCNDLNYKSNVSTHLAELFAIASERFFENYRRLNHVFIVKKSGKDTTFKVHQDWNVVDETKYQSINVWVPLHDVDEKSGALWVLKGSHKVNRHIRGAGYLFPDYSKYTSELEKAAVSVKLKAGQAIVFYHSVIHGSPPNLSASNRVAACFSVIPKQVPLCIYFQPTKDAELEVHEPNDDFMFNYSELRKQAHILAPTKRPLYILSNYVNSPIVLKELDTFLKPKKDFFSFLKLK